MEEEAGHCSAIPATHRRPRVGGGSSCDAFPPAKQLRCVEVWKDLYKEDRPAIAQFGLDQLSAGRRQDAAQQHLAQNMDFIKQATERRLARFNERMASGAVK